MHDKFCFKQQITKIVWTINGCSTCSLSHISSPITPQRNNSFTMIPTCLPHSTANMCRQTAWQLHGKTRCPYCSHRHQSSVHSGTMNMYKIFLRSPFLFCSCLPTARTNIRLHCPFMKSTAHNTYHRDKGHDFEVVLVWVNMGRTAMALLTSEHFHQNYKRRRNKESDKKVTAASIQMAESREMSMRARNEARLWNSWRMNSRFVQLSLQNRPTLFFRSLRFHSASR